MQEDTSRDLNPLYNNLHEAALLFGRGMRAGIDRREQKKTVCVCVWVGGGGGFALGVVGVGVCGQLRPCCWGGAGRRRRARRAKRRACIAAAAAVLLLDSATQHPSPAAC